jgi:hypothetical protein
LRGSGSAGSRLRGGRCHPGHPVPVPIPKLQAVDEPAAALSAAEDYIPQNERDEHCNHSHDPSDPLHVFAILPTAPRRSRLRTRMGDEADPLTTPEAGRHERDSDEYTPIGARQDPGQLVDTPPGPGRPTAPLWPSSWPSRHDACHCWRPYGIDDGVRPTNRGTRPPYRLGTPVANLREAWTADGMQL